jgi:hypothetical protein
MIGIVLVMPSLAYANGGGPLLLIINVSTFLFGSLWIIGIEGLLYKKIAKLTIKESFFEALIINLISTIVIGIGFPLILAIIGYAGSMLPKPFNNYFLLLGTWVFEGIQYKGNSLLIVVVLGFIITYLLTVPFEAWCLKKYWNKKQIKVEITANKLSWICNSISYVGLATIALLTWREF